MKKRRVVFTHVSTNMIHICVSFSVCCCRCDDSWVFIFRPHNYSSLLTLTAERGKSNFPFFSVSISSPPSHRHLTAHNSATVLLLFSVSGFFGTGSIIVVDVVWRTFGRPSVRFLCEWWLWLFHFRCYSVTECLGDTQKQNKSPGLAECELMLVITRDEELLSLWDS